MSSFNLLKKVVDKQKIREIFDLVRPDAYRVQPQILDCSVSWCRENLDWTYEEFFEKMADEKWFTTCILRDTYEKPYYEFCISTMTTVSHFLYLYVDASIMRRDEWKFRNIYEVAKR